MKMKFRIWFLLMNLRRPIPSMPGLLRQQMSMKDRMLDRFYTFCAFKFFMTPLSHWGIRRLGRLHGRYNYPPGKPYDVNSALDEPRILSSVSMGYLADLFDDLSSEAEVASLEDCYVSVARAKDLSIPALDTMGATHLWGVGVAYVEQAIARISYQELLKKVHTAFPNVPYDECAVSLVEKRGKVDMEIHPLSALA